MLTVTELLSYPLFQNFYLVTDDTGLLNNVSGTGIFEWESKEDIEATFAEGEFVMTTLSIAKDDPMHAAECLKILIDNKVAAVAIKDVHYSELSPDTIQFANEHHVPIFFFSGTYIDDIIYTIKSVLVSENSNEQLLQGLKNIVNAEATENITKLALKLNPFFHHTHLSYCAIPKATTNGEEMLDHFYSNSKIPKQIAHRDGISYSLIRCEKFLIFLFTTSKPLPDNLSEDAFADQILSDFALDFHNFRIGRSNLKTNLSQLNIALQESIFAAVTSIIDNLPQISFNNIGVNQLLFPLYNSIWAQQYYKTFHQKLTDYDQNHKTRLHETLIKYIQSEGDMVLTADRLYQHSNTIRYRLAKIKDILEINERSDTDIQLYLYVKLYEIYQILSEDFIL